MKRREEVEAGQGSTALDILQGDKLSSFGMRFDPVQGGGAQRLHMIRESFIREMTRLAITHQAINLSQGFPDFDPPRAAIEAAHNALESGGNQYTITWGTLPLREAIAAKMEKWYDLRFDPNEHITVTCGVTEAILATLMGIINKGDEVIIIEPYHEGYLPAVVFAGGVPHFVPLESPDYILDLDRLRDAFNERTKAIIINTPHNPTGHVFTRQEMEGIAELCMEFNIVAITDEIYEHITYDGHLHFPLATVPGMADRTVTISGLGKTFAMTGWRLGYACTLNPLSTILRTVHDFMTICAPAPLQAACAAVLQLPDEYYAQLKTDYTQRRDKMMEIVRKAGFLASPVQGSYYVMADFSNWDFDGDDYSFARWLPANLGVAVVPGSCFYGTKGMGKKTVRFAFAKKMETLEAAGARLWR
ncbi:MAG: aminotransferase class I/II-fold pyridoxal phosphate-dependent enzyme [Syntrophorhabdaceae bacterium]|nr:aminotransferase class I/II-fold pyridoxal phosphate-dependent enzyme [Syntrophorhabdaceae bacterium]MDD4195592.1 aminotransferase class I/II-fold pyridoxal phosphate-dependent enzyme [Syntrophorhabdaceae bacterium]